MLPKIERAKEFRASMAFQAQNLAPTLPGESVCWNFSIVVSTPIHSSLSSSFCSNPLLPGCLLLRDIFYSFVLLFWIWNSHWKLQIGMMIMEILFHQGLIILGFKLQMKYLHLALWGNSKYQMVQNLVEKVCVSYILCHNAHILVWL